MIEADKVKLFHQKKYISTDWFSLLFLFGIFFSSITLNIIPGETSALAGLSAFLVLISRGKSALTTFIIQSFILILLSFYCFSFSHDNYYEIIKQYFAYSQIILVFLCVKYIKFRGAEKYITAWIIVELLIFFIQYSGIGSTLLDPAMSFLISRGSAIYSIDSGRGISGFSSEPSHVAFSAFVHAFLMMYCGHLKGKDYSFLCFIYIFLSIALSASGTGVALFLIFCIPFLIYKLKMAIVILILVCFALVFVPFPDRLTEILNLIQYADSNTVEAIFYISGFRFPSVVASYVYAFSHFSIGGVGSWYARILDAYDYIGVDIKTLGHFADQNIWGPTKPNSLFATISLEFGFIGLAFSMSMLYLYVKIYKNTDPKFKPYLLVAIFGSFLLSTVGNPGFPLVLALALIGNLKKNPLR